MQENEETYDDDKTSKAKGICQHPDCFEKAKCGLINSTTRIFEKIMCDEHKKSGMFGKSPSWRYRNGDFKIICRNRGCELIDSPEQWEIGAKNSGNKYKPKILHLKCGEIFTMTSIDKFVGSKRMGCTCTTSIPWFQRLNEFHEICAKRECKLLDTPEEWKSGTEKHGAFYKPKIVHLNCGGVFTKTTIRNFVNPKQLGCMCTRSAPWCDRFNEFLQICKERECILLDSITEFEKGAKDPRGYKPKIQCLKCRKIVSTTTIDHFVQGCLGCNCTNKTEGKLLDLLPGILKKITDEFKIKTQILGPPSVGEGTTKFDFYIEISSYKIIIELDGRQHFTRVSNWDHEFTTQNDLIKENYVREMNNHFMIRVLQEDVWKDQYDWQGFIRRNFERILSGKITQKVITSDRSEYTSGIYAELRNNALNIEPSTTTQTTLDSWIV